METIRIEKTMKGADGKERKAILVKDENGTFIGYVGYAKDFQNRVEQKK
jgi:predicted GIY-YIG superfamily endonuclease